MSCQNAEANLLQAQWLGTLYIPTRLAFNHFIHSDHTVYLCRLLQITNLMYN